MYSFFKKQLQQQGITIHVATMDDVSALQTLAMTTFKETYSDYTKKKSTETIDLELKSIYGLKNLKHWIEDNESHCLVMTMGTNTKQIIGYSLMQFSSNQARLSKIYLLQAQQGKGLGRILLEANFDYLRKHRQIDCLSLEVWDQNEKAKAFYKRMGFHATGEKILYGNSDPDHPFFDEVLVRERGAGLSMI